MTTNAAAGVAPGTKEKDVTVHFKHLGELETENFKADPDATLQEIWAQAYAELEIEPEPRDVLQTKGKPNPIDLMPHLSLSLAAAQAQGLCDMHFEIAARTGGA